MLPRGVASGPMIRALPPLLALLLHGLSMLLPTYDQDGKPGHFAWLGSFIGMFEGPAFAAGVTANVLFIVALALAIPRRTRGATVVLGAVGAALAVCSLKALPDLLTHPGWWVWTASFVALAAWPSAIVALVAWLREPAGAAGGVARVAALALPAAVIASFALLVLGVTAPLPLDLVDPRLTMVGSAAVGAVVLASVVRRFAVLPRATPEPLEPHEPLLERGPGLWTVDGEWRGGALRRRMTVLRVGDGLVLHAAIRLSEPELARLDALGPVVGIVVPNRFHDSDAPFYAERHPRALVLVPAALRESQGRRLRIEGTIEADWPASWAPDLEALELGGTRSHETAFLHRASRTLVLTDLVFNLRATDFRGRVERWLMSRNGIVDRFGPSRLFLWAFMKDRAALRASLATIDAWDFERVVMSHGHVVEQGGKAALRAAFAR
jgi:hypothetical protein